MEGSLSERERLAQAGFVVRLHWGIALLTPILTLLSGKTTHPAVWVVLGVFLLSTTVLQAFVSLRLPIARLSKLGYAVLILDLLFVTALVWARGGLSTDAYHFYYLVIAGAGILFGVKESLAFALLAGMMYGLVVWLDAGEVSVLGRVAIRTVYFVLIGVAVAYLASQAERQRRARAETQRSLVELHETHTELKAYAREMAQRAITDGLTGLYNHTYFHQRLGEELTRSVRYGRPLSLMMLDLDDFKAYNDSCGHTKGDVVLAQVARVISVSVRKVDVVCRYGGEEFAVIMAETDAEAAHAAAERVREAVESMVLPTEKAGAGRTLASTGALTVSVGVACHPTHAKTRVALIEVADRALYRSKRTGKNLVSAPDDSGDSGVSPAGVGPTT
jgi:diguanylate cyclase (GGDEF)-like protein